MHLFVFQGEILLKCIVQFLAADLQFFVPEIRNGQCSQGFCYRSSKFQYKILANRHSFILFCRDHLQKWSDWKAEHPTSITTVILKTLQNITEPDFH